MMPVTAEVGPDRDAVAPYGVRSLDGSCRSLPRPGRGSYTETRRTRSPQSFAMSSVSEVGRTTGRCWHRAVSATTASMACEFSAFITAAVERELQGDRWES